MRQVAGRALASHEQWIGVDLDGTLAKYGSWQGDTVIGEPVPAMVERVKQWLSEGKTVKIFTARAANMSAEAQQAIQTWSLEHIGQVLPITCEKDPGMTELWDDKAVRVQENTGEVAHTKSALSMALARVKESVVPTLLDDLHRRGLRFPTARIMNQVMPTVDPDDLDTLRYVFHKYGYRPVHHPDPHIECWEGPDSVAKLYLKTPSSAKGRFGLVLV